MDAASPISGKWQKNVIAASSIRRAASNSNNLRADRGQVKPGGRKGVRQAVSGHFLKGTSAMSNLPVECGACHVKFRYRGSRSVVPCPRCKAEVPIPAAMLAATPAMNEAAATAGPALSPPLPSSPSLAEVLGAPAPTTAASATVAVAPPTIAAAVPLQQVETEPAGNEAVRTLADLGIGMVVAAAAFGLTSFHKEALTLPGLIGLFCGGLVLLAVKYYALQAVRPAGPGSPSVTRRILGLPATVCLLFFLSLSLVDLFGPFEQGFVNHLLVGRKVAQAQLLKDEAQQQQQEQLRLAAEEHRRAEARKKEQFARLQQQWDQVDFILVNPGYRVVGLRAIDQRGERGFRVVAKAADTDLSLFEGVEQETPSAPRAKAKEIISHFWKRRQPVFSFDTGLAQRVFAEVAEGDELRGENLDKVARYWEPTRFVPAKPAVAYLDAKTNLRRFGFALGQRENQLLFCDLVPERSLSRTSHDGHRELIDGFFVEPVSMVDRIKPDSLAMDLAVSDLKQQADTLDVFLMEMLRIVQQRQSQATNLSEKRAPCLYVAKVESDLTVENLTKAMRADLEKRNLMVADELKAFLKPYEGRAVTPWEILDELRRAAMEKEKELARANLARDIRAKYEEEVEFLRRHIAAIAQLVEQERSLGGEIRKRLNRAQLVMVDRSTEFKDVLAAKVEGKKWASEGVSVDAALTSGLIDATHVLLTEIRSPRSGGSCELSMRLVDVSTGAIIWEDQADRRPGGNSGQTLAAAKDSDVPSNPAFTSLDGKWRNNDGDELEVKDDGQDVQVNLLRSNTAQELDVRLRRQANGSLSTVFAYIKFKNDTARRRLELTIKPIDGERFEMDSSSYIYNPRTRRIESGPRVTYIFKRL